ncbi:MAG TPA: hypothetical protein ENK57_20615, partial [Polyangiaceae bacterium]|nr:hypothetical protein [Polyangiaceae bacterium]
MTNPRDGGTIQLDAGVASDAGSTGSDSGASATDGGPGDGGGDGCSCRVGSSSRNSSGASLLFALVITALLFRRRRA